MFTFQAGGLLIVLLGVAFIAVSMPVMRILPRASSLTASVGTGMVAWLARIFGLIMCGLGIVTLLQH